MNPAVVSVITLLVCLAIKVPVFVAILAGSLLYFVLTPGLPSLIFAQRITSGIESIPLLAVPFFVGLGAFMNHTGVSQRVLDFCTLIVGRMTGGLAQVNVMLSMLMGGMSGSALADAAMSAKILVPEMERKGYTKEFSSVVTASSAMITPLIPPSIGMILYGSIANVSIARLFIAGIGPGILLCIALMILVRLISKKRDYKPIRTEPLVKGELWSASKKAFLPFCLPVVIIGGIRFGVFTPSEAGSVAVVYAIVLGLLYREMTLEKFFISIKETVLSTAGIMLIVGAASSLAWVLTREQIPQAITQIIVNSIDSKYVFLIAVNIFLLTIGMFIEGNALMLILVPILAPVAQAYGINEIQFAMTFIFNMSIGAITPPVGTLMFITCSITKCQTKGFIKEALPFYILLLTCLMLITFVPFITLGLVNLVF
ncbi:MAG: TRAP transporter large permease [Defluviitaleaceae bacterium]|nr:TRAP transporter large permease [Defluviitaleaceae bacterium]